MSAIVLDRHSPNQVHLRDQRHRAIGIVNPLDSKSKRHRRRSYSSSDSDDNPRSAITGQKLKLKVAKSSEDKKREKNRGSLLDFLNASYD
ncbi:hypothetical protein BGZ97_009751 [Linnemannia gamsii]|uniref:Uncharacterized protein n=1 Tax=Linnemannia gamsii TaxID=64522 RepID=A0A9P6UPH8_9FUNG|nr:hypothetical protein BGZ97_009751 [Linnemannia gamsii]